MSKKNRNNDENSVKKPFYQRKWFIVIVVIVLIGAVGNLFGGGGSSGSGGTTTASSEKSAEVVSSESVPELSEEISSEEENPNVISEDEKVDIQAAVQILLDNYIDGYKIDWSSWNIARFDDQGEVYASCKLTLKDSSYKQSVMFIGHVEDDEHRTIKTHFLSLGNDVIQDDGYADEFFANIQELQDAYASNE